MLSELDKAIEVREGQSLKTDSLETYLRNAMDLPKTHLEILQFPSGYSNLTYLLKFGEKELVLRRPPKGVKIKSGHDMGREFRILSGLNPIYKKVPKPFLFCEDQSIIGAPFYIMERINGVIFRGHTPKDQLPDSNQMRNLSEALVNTLVEIHSLDYHAAGLENLGRPDGYIIRQIEGWTKRYINAKTDELKSLEKTYTWLNNNIPPVQKSAFIHNDFKYDNLIISQNKDFKIKGILDWEMATLGDPLMDLGTTLGYWIQESDPDFLKENNMNITLVKGNLTRSELVEYYAKKSNTKIVDIPFYYVFGLFKIAVIIQQIYFRYKNGFTTDIRFKNLNRAVELYGKMALQALQKNKIDNLY
ncbi:MAG: phosphotransferase family protein [Flavobacteriaceae bacterium]